MKSLTFGRPQLVNQEILSLLDENRKMKQEIYVIA